MLRDGMTGAKQGRRGLRGLRGVVALAVMATGYWGTVAWLVSLHSEATSLEGGFLDPVPTGVPSIERAPLEPAGDDTDAPIPSGILPLERLFAPCRRPHPLGLAWDTPRFVLTQAR